MFYKEGSKSKSEQPFVKECSLELYRASAYLTTKVFEEQLNMIGTKKGEVYTYHSNTNCKQPKIYNYSFASNTKVTINGVYASCCSVILKNNNCDFLLVSSYIDINTAFLTCFFGYKTKEDADSWNGDPNRNYNNFQLLPNADVLCHFCYQPIGMSTNGGTYLVNVKNYEYLFFNAANIISKEHYCTAGNGRIVCF